MWVMPSKGSLPGERLFAPLAGMDLFLPAFPSRRSFSLHF